MSKLKKITVFLIIGIFSFSLTMGQLVQFNFNTSPYLNPSNTSLHISASDFALSSGTIETNITTGTYFTDEPYIQESGGWTQTSAAAAKYFFITVIAEAGYEFTISSVSFDAYATDAGPSAVSILLDAMEEYTQDMPGSTFQTINHSITGYSGLTSLTVKIAGWNNGSRATTGTGDFRMDNLILTGSVSALPAMDSTSSVSASSFVIPDEISSLTNSANGLKVFEMVFTDSASGDGMPTIIDGITLKPGAFNQFTDWTTIIAGATLTGPDIPDGINGTISEQQITFPVTGLISIAEGASNAETYALSIWLTNSLPDADGKQPGFLVDSTGILCNSSGSVVHRGSVSTGENKLTIQVEATQLQVSFPASQLWTNELFDLNVQATDVHGNMDTDQNPPYSISTQADEGALLYQDDPPSTLINGNLEVQNLYFSGADTVVFQVTATGLPAYESDSFLIGKKFMVADFENSHLTYWQDTTDWTATTSTPIEGSFSLKHNLTGVGGSSFISKVYTSTGFGDGTTIWQLALKNGNFDPSASNKFGYFLMASQSNLAASNLYGYAVGVNLTGSDDRLSLWRIDSTGTKSLVVDSDLDWNANTLAAIEVIREPDGTWQLGYNTSGTFTNLVYSARAKDLTYTKVAWHGLTFTFTSSYAGLLWCDQLKTFQMNAPPVVLKAESAGTTTVQLLISEAVQAPDAQNLSNYTISSQDDPGIVLQNVVFNPAEPNRVIMEVNRLITATYEVSVQQLTDMDGSTMQPQTISFEYKVPPVRGDVVIDEIMFDPSPVVTLPDYDYLELVNRSSNPFNLKNWILDIGGTISTFPDSIIQPGEYLVVTSATAISEFTGYGKVVGIISSSALTITGKTLILRSSAGEIIDSLKYNADWITDPDKADGGWSIEKIDPDNLCGTRQNWAVSVDESGGTPGRLNSVDTENMDNIPPSITGHTFLSTSIIKLSFSEEVTPKSIENPLNWSFVPDLGSADSIAISAEQTEVIYYSSQEFPVDQLFSLEFSGISDICDNLLTDTIITLLFHLSQPFDLVINEIMADPTPTVGLPESDYLELYNRSDYPTDLTNWKIRVGTTTKIIPEVQVDAGGYLIICQTGFAGEFAEKGEVVELLSSSTLPSTGKDIALFDTTGQVIDSVYYLPSWYKNTDKADGGWSLERIDPGNTCGLTQNWAASVDDLGGTPGRQNSVFANNPDQKAPEVSAMLFLQNNILEVEFSEELNQSTVSSTLTWNFSPSVGMADSIRITSDLKSAYYYSSGPFVTDSLYQLTLSGISDVCGNIMNDTKLALLFHPAQPFDLAINEIMADPTPSVGLPESDYLEIYNRSAYPADLTNWKIRVGTTSKIIPEVHVDAGGYLIICQTGFTAEFSEMGEVIELLSSSTLPSTGKDVVLFDTTGRVIDSVYYLPSWYKNTDKADGGWSLERIDPNNLCSAYFNWTASKNPSGGTPGGINSVYQSNPDTLAPQVISWRPVSANRIDVLFSEVISVQSLYNYPAFEIDQGIGIPDSSAYSTVHPNRIELYFAASLQNKQTYQLHFSGITDACLNQMPDTSVSFIYYIPEPYDVVINEIMADAEPVNGLPVAKYVELYNRSNYPVDLTGWTFWYTEYFKTLPEYILPPNQFVVLCVTGKINLLKEFGDVLDILSSTSLTSTGRLLQLKDTTGQLISLVDYRNSWFTDADKAEGGWSLEQIDPNNTCSGSTNWTASADERGGTPGSLNSVDAPNIDTGSPEITHLKLGGLALLNLIFSEPLDTANLLDKVHYTFSETGNAISSVQLTNEEATSVQLNVNHAFTEGTAYHLLISGLQDRCGNAMNDTSLNFVFHLIEVNDVVVSELMIDPSPVVGLPEQEYIELYNRSNKTFDLEGWKIGVNGVYKSLLAKEINPKSYLILCSSKGYDELSGFGDALIVPSFPSLPNAGGRIELADTASNPLNAIDYSDAWYNDADKDNGGWSLELIDPDNTCGRNYNWTASVSETGGTPGQVNSVNAPNIDQTPLAVIAVIAVSTNELWIDFTEFPDESSVLSASNYALKNIGNPVSVMIDSLNQQRVKLQFRLTMNTGESQQLTVKSGSDFCGNVMTDTLIEFTYYQPELYDVVINEIMPDPDPSVELPPGEFIELYNNSGYNLTLLNWTLKVGNSSGTISYANFPKQSYLIVCGEENKELFAPYGLVGSLTKMPSLPQSGSLSLFQSNGELICSTPYSSIWYADDFKAQGGFSLERIDFNNPLETSGNWQETQSTEGGTPGRQNSVYRSNPDGTPPDLLRVLPMNDSVVRVLFSEVMKISEFTPTSFTVDHQVGSPESVTWVVPEYVAVDLHFTKTFETGQTYQLETDVSLTDIAGNLIGNNSGKFALAYKAQPNDVVINELLYNPRPNGVDFVELFNRAVYPVNLKQLLVASRNDEGSLKSPEAITNDGYILFPDEYVALSTNGSVIRGQYLTTNEFAFADVEALPSFPDNEGTVVLIDTLGTVIDEFSYSDKMQFALLTSSEGYSLERVNPDRPARESSNWHSAAEQVEATPGYQNSMFAESGLSDAPIGVEPEVFSPDNDGYNDQVNFHYQFNEPGYVANISILNARGRPVRKLVNNELLAIEGTYAWDGLDDDQQKVPIGIYVVYVEVFNLKGKVTRYQKTCVVASRF